VMGVRKNTVRAEKSEMKFLPFAIKIERRCDQQTAPIRCRLYGLSWHPIHRKQQRRLLVDTIVQRQSISEPNLHKPKLNGHIVVCCLVRWTDEPTTGISRSSVLEWAACDDASRSREHSGARGRVAIAISGWGRRDSRKGACDLYEKEVDQQW
jgi:hypothetical protein